MMTREDLERKIRISQGIIDELNTENQEQQLYINHLLQVKKDLSESIKRMLKAADRMSDLFADMRTANVTADVQDKLAEVRDEKVRSKFSKVTIGEDGRYE